MAGSDDAPVPARTALVGRSICNSHAKSRVASTRCHMALPKVALVSVSAQVNSSKEFGTLRPVARCKVQGFGDIFRLQRFDS